MNILTYLKPYLDLIRFFKVHLTVLRVLSMHNPDIFLHRD